MDPHEDTPMTELRLARRGVRVALVVLSAVVIVGVLEGIVGTLWGPVPGSSPSSDETPQGLDAADCADRLATLESRFRGLLAARFAAADPDPPEWTTLVRPLETERRALVRSCELEQASPRADHRALADTGEALEEAFSATGLLWERHRADGARRLEEARAALRRARRALAAPGRPAEP